MIRKYFKSDKSWSIVWIFVMAPNFRTKLYDKRDDFNFVIVNFPFICSNIPAAPAYGVYISQLIWYSRACGSYQDFLDRGLLLTRKLLNQGFLLVNITNSFSLSFLPLKNAKYIQVVEILLALIWMDGRGTITSKSRTFVVLQLVTIVALIEYT
jgi:hypothetical protein